MTSSPNQIFAFWVGYAAEQAAAWLLGARAKIARPRNILLLLLAVTAFASGFVEAQAPAPTYPVEQVIPRVSDAVNAALSKLGGGGLNSMGAAISAFFLIALMVWTALKTMAGGKGLGELIGEWVPIWVSFAFVYAFLNQAGAAAITSTMDAIATAIGGQSMSSLSSAIDVVAKPLIRSIITVSEMPMMTEVDAFSPSTWVPFATASIGTIITKAITVIFLLISSVIGMATVIMSFISLQLVLFLAPVMVPFLMFKPMSWLFDSWLRFLLGACMMKIVLAFMLIAAAGVLGAMGGVQAELAKAAETASPSDQAVADLLLHAVMMIFALLSTLLIMQVPSIATGILSGGAGSTGFGGIKGLTQSPSARITNDVPSAAAAATGRAGLGAVRAGAGARAGFEAGRGLQHGNTGDRTKLAGKAYQAMYDRARATTHGPMLPKGR